MKIVVIGGTGLIGSQVVKNLQQRGHEAIPASPRSGVNALTNEGLSEALVDAQVVVDVSNSPSFADQAVLEFFQTSSRNLLAAEAAAGVQHHVALSVIGADRMPDSGYMRAKLAQEKLIKAAKTPYTIVRATQFYEFLAAIGDSAMQDGVIHLPTALMQPMAAKDVAAAVTEVALAAPVNGIVEIAGPLAIPMYEAVGRALAAKADSREVIKDDQARYFGEKLERDTLTPVGQARLAKTSLEQWLSSS
jgi:uncharacterized protein YbjT (DUF2867 family)